ncbi:MAG TPA: hypothetical protein VJK51_03910 [Candidatus Nanoarchaeia archaeon]|nr:hypothetical protein [Candidatus Nanoarchaeia archaeon]
MHEEDEKDEENLQYGMQYWDEDTQRVIDELKEELASFPDDVIDDAVVRKKIGALFLTVMERTSHTVEDIKQSSYTLAGFVRYRFLDGLDRICRLAGELDLEKGIKERSVYAKWGILRLLVEDYVRGTDEEESAEDL